MDFGDYNDFYSVMNIATGQEFLTVQESPLDALLEVYASEICNDRCTSGKNLLKKYGNLVIINPFTLNIGSFYVIY